MNVLKMLANALGVPAMHPLDIKDMVEKMEEAGKETNEEGCKRMADFSKLNFYQRQYLATGFVKATARMGKSKPHLGLHPGGELMDLFLEIHAAITMAFNPDHVPEVINVVWFGKWPDLDTPPQMDIDDVIEMVHALITDEARKKYGTLQMEYEKPNAQGSFLEIIDGATTLAEKLYGPDFLINNQTVNRRLQEDEEKYAHRLSQARFKAEALLNELNEIHYFCRHD